MEEASLISRCSGGGVPGGERTCSISLFCLIFFVILSLPLQPSVQYTVPEDSCNGPVLEAGPDYSQGRKTDYPTETNDE